MNSRCMNFAVSMLPSKILTPRGYSVEKSAVTSAEVTVIEKELTVRPQVAKAYAAGSVSFKLWIESPTRYYLPTAWATAKFGAAAADTRPEGDALPAGLKFQGTLRPHQVEALTAFRAEHRIGGVCLLELSIGARGAQESFVCRADSERRLRV